MQHTYCLRTDEIFDEDGKVYTVYGIDVVNESGITEKSVKDVFFDFSEAVKFVNNCNTLQLDIVHLMDVVEDILGWYYLKSRKHRAEMFGAFVVK